MIKVVRGATTISQESDEYSQMINQMNCLIDTLAQSNSLKPANILSIQFTQTNDLQMLNAATALRIAKPEYSSVPLFCSCEPVIRNSLPRTIRILIFWRSWSWKRVQPVYQGDSKKLRPDLKRM